MGSYINMDLQQAIQSVADFTAAQESYARSAYWDSNGYAIGYGNHYYQDGRPVQPGDTITQSAAEDLMMFYLAQNGQAIVNQLSVNIPTGVLAALIDLRYNCGTITVSLLNLINSGASSDQIKTQYLQTCLTSGGNYLQVLADRRQQAWDSLAGNNFGFGSAATTALIALAAAGLVAYMGRKKTA